MLALIDAAFEPEEKRLFDAFDYATREAGLQRASQALIAAAARETPRVLYVEDAHWADAFTLRWIAGVAAMTPLHPLVFIVTSRLTGFSEADLRGTSAETLDLHPLAPADALALARATGAGDERLDQLVARAGGNPLFLEQLLESTRENDEALPSTVQGLMMARVDRLAGRDKAALQAAAAAGQRFTVEFVRRVSGLADYDVGTLLEHHLVKPDGDAYLFQHALMQEAVYATLTKPRRRELHAKAAALYAGRDEVLWAQHLDRADDPGAPAAYAQAARVQAGVYLFEEALALADSGLACAATAADRYALQRQRAQALLELGRTLEAANAFLSALAHAATPLERGRCHVSAAAAHRQGSRHQDALRELEAAEAALGAEPADAERAQLHYLRGSVRFALGKRDDTLADHTRALEHARRLGGGEWEARALSGIADAHFSVGRLNEGRRHFEQCVEACRRLGLDRYALVNEAMLSMAEYLLGNFWGTLPRVHETIAMAERLRDNVALSLLHMQLAFALPYQGKYGEGLKAAERALEAAKKAGSRRFESEGHIVLGLMLMLLGRRSEAYQAAKRGVAISRDTDMAFCGAFGLGVLAWATLDGDERARALAEGEALLAAGTIIMNHAMLRDCAIECAIEAGDRAAARGHAKALLADISGDDVPTLRLIAERGLAWAGDPAESAAARKEHAKLVAAMDVRGRLAHLPGELPAGTTADRV